MSDIPNYKTLHNVQKQIKSIGIKSLAGIDWEKSLDNLDVNDQVNFLTNL